MSYDRRNIQTNPSEKSNVELPNLRGTGANSMSSKRLKSMIALWLVAAFFLTAAGEQETNKNKPGPLMIQEQVAVRTLVVTS